jgi:hypothetical protein
MIEQKLSEVLHQLIDPPRGMRGIVGVADVLHQVLKSAWLIKVQAEPDEGRSKPIFLDVIPSLIELCSSIVHKTEGAGCWVERPDAEKRFKTDHPVYAALYEVSKARSTLSGGRCQLLAHALVASRSGSPARPEGSEKPSANIQAAFRELRRLDSRVLDSVQFEVPSRHGCYKALKEIEQTENMEFDRTEVDQLGHIRRLIGLSLGVEKSLEVTSRKKNGGESFADSQARVTRKEISSDQLGDEGGLPFSLIETSAFESVDVDAGRLDCLPESDVAPGIRNVVASERANPRRGGSLQRSVLQSRHIANQLRRSAQSLTSRWDRLTEHEIGAVISALWWQGAGKNPGVLALGLVLLIGRPLSTILNARLFSSIDQVPEHISGDSVAICREGSFIQVNVPVPERMRPLRQEWQSSLRQTDNQLRLPFVVLLRNLLFDFIGVDDADWSGCLFPRPDIDDIKNSAENVISEVRSEDGARVTITRLQRCLYNEIADVQGDIVDGVVITGNQPATGTHVGIHYYCVPESDLQERYLNAAREMVAVEFKELMAPVALCPERSSYIGSPFCPKPECLVVLIKNLRQRLIVNLQQPLAADTLIDIHNSYTAYIVVFTAFATGYRSVQAPLSRDTDFDPLSGMLVVADKTDSSYSHARLVPVPEILSRQLDLYRQHRERVIEQLWALLGIKKPAHFLFFLSKAGNGTKKSEKLVRVTPVSPTSVTKNLRGISNLPLNLNRHFLRSELRHRGVSAELVDAWMGHWLDGQEPMGRFSTLSPLDYMSGIEPVLNEILDDMGWTSERGLS